MDKVALLLKKKRRIASWAVRRGFTADWRLTVYNASRNGCREYRMALSGRVLAWQVWISNWPNSPDLSFRKNKPIPGYYMTIGEAWVTDCRIQGGQLHLPNGFYNAKWHVVSDSEFIATSASSKACPELKHWLHLSDRGRLDACQDAGRRLART